MALALDSTNSSNVQMHDKVIGQIWNLERDSSSKIPMKIPMKSGKRYRHRATLDLEIY